jgi:SpoVK/Ycf46/Vps4 family AAA+-type ATPase
MNPDNSSIDFIDYLDKYKLKRNHLYNDYALLINLIQNNFKENELNEPDFSGNTQLNNVLPNYYSIYSRSLWNNQKSSFSNWEEKHETDISLNEYIEKINIDINVTSINDLIKITDEYNYDSTKEYNIDLKALHNINIELKKLNKMIGMPTLKKSVFEQLIYFMQGLHKGISTSEFKHTVIYGQPGTGKTEVAKIIGEMYSKLGILKNNVFKKVTRSDLIAGYLGQTALKTKKVIDECIGGVLFIDEAYSLASGNDNNDSYSKECLDTLCEALSDNKDNLMVIIAGYEDELEQTFFRANRGLESRFIWRFKMDKYTPGEMMQIFKKKVSDNEWNFDDETFINEKWFSDRKDNFNNFGRDMELLLSYTKIAHGSRIYGKEIEMRKKITLEDLNKGYETFLNNKNKKPDTNFMHTIYV